VTEGDAPQLVIATTRELGPERFRRIDALCEAAFGRPFAEIWQSIGPGVHVVAELDGTPVGHAMVVEREVHIAERPLRTGYVENVAATPDRHRRGIGSLVMRRIGDLIAADFEVGALATGTQPFYEQLGWLRWRGPTLVRVDGRLERTPKGDGCVMVLPVERTPPFSADAPISIGWRPGAIW
jgi:aminoglycoside 2'-N-acetyltransferase I